MKSASEEMMIRQSFDGAIAALSASRKALGQDLTSAAEILSECFAQSGKLLVCGNGGSAADARHLVAELIGRFKKSRQVGTSGAGAHGRHGRAHRLGQRYWLRRCLRPSG